MTGVWTHRFEVVMRPLRDLDAPPTHVFIETRTAAQAARDAVTQHPDMKVLSVTRETATSGVFSTVKGDERAERAEPAVVLPLARVAGRR